MRKILLSSFVVFGIVLMVSVSTKALFSDTGEVLGNTFTAGTLDLKVDDGDATLTNKFSPVEGQIVPGKSYDTGCVELRNAGNVDGKVSVVVSNLVSNENGLYAAERDDGDDDNYRFDKDGYNNNDGTGELWDQITVKYCFDTGAGSHSTNKVCDWDDTIVKNFSSTQDDYSSLYSIKTDTDLLADKNFVLGAGDKVTFCTGVKFIDDKSNSWWGGQNGLTNNTAMSDDAQYDITFGLTSIVD